MQRYFKINLILTILFNVRFLYKNREPFRSLTKNCLKLNKDESIVSAFLVFVVYKSAVSAVQKSKYVGCFNFLQ